MYILDGWHGTSIANFSSSQTVHLHIMVLGMSQLRKNESKDIYDKNVNVVYTVYELLNNESSHNYVI